MAELTVAVVVGNCTLDLNGEAHDVGPSSGLDPEKPRLSDAPGTNALPDRLVAALVIMIEQAHRNRPDVATLVSSSELRTA